MTHRLHYIDNLKGVLILLVVLGHCIQCTDLDFDHNAVFRYIYSFHMPLFMVCERLCELQARYKMADSAETFQAADHTFFSMGGG